MLILLKKKAQSTAEYVTLIALAAAAIGLVNTYVRKSLANKVKAIADNYADTAGPASGHAGAWQDEESQVRRASRGTQRNVQKNAGLVAEKGREGAFDVKGIDSEAMHATIAGDLSEIEAPVNTVKPASDANTWDKKDEVADVNQDTLK